MTTYKLQLDKRLGAVVEQIAGLAVVNADNAKEQLSGNAQGERGLCGSDDGVDAVAEVGLQDGLLGELALHVGGHPDAGQRALGQKQLARVKHDGCDECKDEMLEGRSASKDTTDA